MLKTTLSALAIVLIASVSAQAKMDCDAQYSNFWEKVTKAAVSLNASQLATINRMGSRAYDACQAGDEQFATNFFEKLAQEGDAKDLDAEAFFKKLAREGDAK